MGTDTSKSLFDQAMNDIMAGNYVAAEIALQQASEINEESTTLYAACWATLLALRGREQEAIEVLEERLETFSTDSNLLLAYGLALEKLEKFEDAEDAFRESLAADSEHPGALRGLSACLTRKGDIIGGCRLAAKAFTLAPDNLVLAKNAVELLEKAGQTSTAYDVMELGAHYNPEDEELVTRSVEHCLTCGEMERAWDLLSQTDSARPWAAGWKASFLDWQGETEKANQLIQDTLRRPAGQDNTFLFHLSNILMRRGEVGAAEAYVEHILASDPQHSGALRIRADFAVGRLEYNPSVDPLASAVAAHDETPGWPRFWSLVTAQEFELAEETLGALAEDERFTSDPVEAARLELAEQLFLVLTTGEESESELHSLDELPVEASCGVLLEFLDILDGQLSKVEEIADFRDVLNEELGNRDPILRLTRYYAMGRWDDLKAALDILPLDSPEEEPEVIDPAHPRMFHELYTLLHALAVGESSAVESFTLENADPNVARNAFDVLFQKGILNPTEQKFLDKLQGEANRVAELELPDPDITDDSAPAYQVGGLINARDADVVYETEDGELIEDFNEEDYEIIEEVEPDPDDPDYEYVWVEEEFVEEEEDEFVEEPQDKL